MNIKHSILYVLFLIILISSCGKKSFSEYEEKDFNKVQGIIISAERTKSPFDSPYMKEIKYEYFVNDSLILKGSENFDYVDMIKGIPIEVLVHKDDKNVSFYWRNGLSENITKIQYEYVMKKTEEAINELN